MPAITETDAWAALERHRASLETISVRELFAAEGNRFDRFSLALGDLLLDYSKNRLTGETVDLLVALAEAADLSRWRERMFAGEPVNATEGRAALHVALRNRSSRPIPVDGVDVMPRVRTGLERIKATAEGIRRGAWRAADRGPITHVVHLGIGGSGLGPALVCAALAPPRPKVPHVSFVSNVDGTQQAGVLAGLDPARTLVVVASKSFRTAETLMNAASARSWLEKRLGSRAIARHMLAITANAAEAKAFGIDPDNVLEIPDWVGGRFSLWSAVGVTIAISLGFEVFEQLLAGAHAMDEHFRTAPLAENMPVVMGLLGVWYRNFWAAASRAVVPYDQRLAGLPAYLQQLDMESNGKRVTRDGAAVACATGPVLWGGVGTDAQHAFFQLLHQGTDVVPVDFLLPAEPGSDLPGHHDMLVANCLAQGAALMRGRTARQAAKGGADGAAAGAHREFPGNRPSTTIVYRRLTPGVLGMLLAVYEHRVFVEATIWGINPFDQWGVELGKQLADEVMPALGGKPLGVGWDGSTRGLIAHLARWRGQAGKGSPG
jgi:glucose-6-phosphate isomerase